MEISDYNVGLVGEWLEFLLSDYLNFPQIAFLYPKFNMEDV